MKLSITFDDEEIKDAIYKALEERGYSPSYAVQIIYDAETGKISAYFGDVKKIAAEDGKDL